MRALNQVVAYSARRRARNATKRAARCDPTLRLDSTPEGSERHELEALSALLEYETEPLGAGPAPSALLLHSLEGNPVPSGHSAWWPMLSTRAEMLELKMQGDPAICHPTALPRDLLAAMQHACLPSMPLDVHAAVAPGCTLLTVCALLEGCAGGEGLTEPGVALRELLKDQRVAEHLRRMQRVTLRHAGGACASARFGVAESPPPRGGKQLSALQGPSGPTPAAMPAPVLPPSLHPRAVLCTAPLQLRVDSPLPSLRCRVHGRFLSCTYSQGDRVLALPPPEEEGVAWVELAAGATIAQPRPMLLVRAQDILAEVNGDSAGDDDTGLVQAIVLLGHVLRPDCSAAVAARARAATLRRRWHAAAARCLDTLERCGEQADVRADAWLLHEAVSGVALAGGPLPMRMLQLLTRSGEAVVSWFTVDGAGRSPSQHAAEGDAHLLRFNGVMRARLRAGRALALTAAVAQLELGMFYWPALADGACAALRASSSDDDATVVACALLNQAVAFADTPDGSAMPDAPNVEAEAAWRLQQCLNALEIWAAYHALYVVAMLITAAPMPDWSALMVSSPPSARAGSLPLEHMTWAASSPVKLWIAPVSYPYQLAATLLLAALLTPPGRGLLARNLSLFSALQLAVHGVACTLHYTWYISMAGRDARGSILVWPVRLGVAMALFTAFAAACLPMRPRHAAPLLLVRGALPVLVWAYPDVFYQFWPLTSGWMAVFQAAACAAALAIALRRERAWRARYRSQRQAGEKQKEA